MLYIVFVVILTAAALHDHRTGTTSHAPQPWDGNATPASTRTERASRHRKDAPAYRNPYQLKPYTRAELYTILGPTPGQPRRPSNPLAHPFARV